MELSRAGAHPVHPVFFTTANKIPAPSALRVRIFQKNLVFFIEFVSSGYQ
jgi:hypothetical protein